MLIRVRGNSLQRIKHIMKRVSKENIKPQGRLIGKLSHSAPVFLFDYMLMQVFVVHFLWITKSQKTWRMIDVLVPFKLTSPDSSRQLVVPICYVMHIYFNFCYNLSLYQIWSKSVHPLHPLIIPGGVSTFYINYTFYYTYLPRGL